MLNPLTRNGIRVSGFEETGHYAHSLVGAVTDGTLVSTGQQGVLVYGPYVPMDAGLYDLTVTGSATSTSSAWVDVASGTGTLQHAKFALTPTGEEEGVLASGQVVLEKDVTDLEVRVWGERTTKYA